MADSLLEFKRLSYAKEFANLDGMLRAIIYMGVAYVWAKFKKPIIVTSVFRDDNLHSVHYYWRGCDIRTRHYTESESTAIASFFNNYAIYDADRPAMRVAVHGDATHQDHIHIQVHPKTRLFFAPIDRDVYINNP